VHPRVLKEMAQVLTESVSIFFNTSLTTGNLSSIWKQASITPIFKKSNKQSPSNYRPVTLTCVLCKTLE
ncbi:hypothetical protein CAPTEDRAFT_66749, partial [Capitella teleta]